VLLDWQFILSSLFHHTVCMVFLMAVPTCRGTCIIYSRQQRAAENGILQQCTPCVLITR